MSALDDLRNKSLMELSSIETRESLLGFKSRYLGKKGLLKEVLSSLATLSKEERSSLGQEANALKNDLENEILKKEFEISQILKDQKLKECIDVSEPAVGVSIGSLHPLSITYKDIYSVLRRLGFESAKGPLIEHDFYNFEALNIPADHPGRDMQDTFYIDDKVVLRTQTSPVQIRAMLYKKHPPIKIMSFGKVFRKDNEDPTHTPMFHQIEGLFVDEKISLADLKGTLEILVQEIFLKDTKIRMRPSFFPFTEPSIEVDVSCFSCKDSEGCRICKKSGWIEVLGAGMVDPSVLAHCDIDSEKYQGFAFGLGIERIAMLRYGIFDIRLFYENDLRFLRQF